MKFSITQNGKELSKRKYNWDENTQTLSTNENNLILNFSKYNGITFKTGHSCTFNTGYSCTFKTGYSCIFKTGHYCTFKTNNNCTFNTGSNCIFNTGSDCTFNTGYSCTFKTGHYCTFNTGRNCIFDTGSNCTFTCEKKCVCIRRDIYEVIEIPENKTIKLNEYGVKGYSFQLQKRKIVIDGKKIEMSEESYQNLKESLINP